MAGKPILPWRGAAVALVGIAGMLLAGAGWWLSAGILLLWLGSLWLVSPEPAIPAATDESAGTPRETRRDVLEGIGIPLIIVENARIAAANGAARKALGGHIVGQDARIVLRHPDALRLVDMDDGATVTIAGFAGGRTLWQLTRRRIDGRAWLIEMIDRTSEADISRAHTDFVANASHELRTPLSAIIGYVETLADADGGIDAATSTRFLETVLREARRMQPLVSDLISLSHVEAEKHDLPAQKLDFAQLVCRVAEEVAAIAGADRVAVTAPDAGCVIRGDRVQLEQLVRNLLDNALKYGDPAEPVRVSLAEGTGDRVMLQVMDKGAGIAPEHLPHLTRRFYRTDPGRSRAGGGTGLGLAIVKHIVERHRGQLDITSTLGTGTTVTVSLPSVGQA